MPRIAPPALIAVSALALCSCGGGSSDADQIRALIKDVGHTPADLCTKYATAQILDKVGGRDGCLRAAAAPNAADPKVQVLSVQVNGATATARIHGNTGDNTVGLTKVSGSWKVSSSG